MLGLRYAFKEAFIGIRHAKTMALLALGTTASSLLVFGLFLLMTAGLYGAVNSVKARIDIEAYLVTDCSSKDALSLEKRIRGTPGVQSVTYVSKEEAASRFTEIFGDSLLAVLSGNPLPSSLVIVPEPGFRTSEKIGQIVSSVRSYDDRQIIDDIDYGAAWLKEFDVLLLGILIVDLFLGAVVGMASVLVVSNAVRLSVLARREVIEIMRLVGATDGFIRRPFFIEGLLEGMLGGTIAAVALCVVLYLLNLWPFQLFNVPRLVGEFSLLPGLPELPSESFAKWPAVLIVMGALLGALGSTHSLRRVLAKPARP